MGQLFFYTKMKSDEPMSIHVLDAYQELKSEDNKIFVCIKMLD